MTKENSMLRLIAAAVSLFASLLGASNQAPAQQYPERAIKFVVPFAPGSATDALARILAQKLGDAQGWTVVVENIAGASGMLAAQNVARLRRMGTPSSSPAIPRTLPIRACSRSCRTTRLRISSRWESSATSR
jgi:tripartite-type tricarboxylate transporter receptor subunit TctC